MTHEKRSTEGGYFPPGEDCELPEPIRDPEQMMQTATCQHGVTFLLVSKLDETCIWYEANPYWDRGRSQLREPRSQYWKEPRYGIYQQFQENTFETGSVAGFDYGEVDLKNLVIRDNTFTDCWDDEGGAIGVDTDDQAE